VGAVLPATRHPLAPHNEQKKDTKQTARKGGQKQDEKSELDAQKGANHGHELGITHAHAFHTAQCLVNKSNAQNEGCSKDCSREGVDERGPTASQSRPSAP